MATPDDRDTLQGQLENVLPPGSRGLVYALLPVVVAYVEEQSRAYAKAAIRWAANDVPMPYDVRMDLQARADWIGAGHQLP